MNSRLAKNGTPIICNDDNFTFSTLRKEGALEGINIPPELKKISMEFIYHKLSFQIVMKTLSSLFGMTGYEDESISGRSFLKWVFDKQNEEEIILIQEGDRIVYDPNYYGKDKGAISIEMQNIIKWRSKYHDKIGFLIWRHNFAEFAQVIALLYGNKTRKAICKQPKISFSFTK